MSPTVICQEMTADTGERRPVSPTRPLPVYNNTPAGGGLGLSFYSNTALAGTKAVVKASAATLSGLSIGNPNGSIGYVQVFNKLTAGVTVGTTAPDLVFTLPASGTLNLSFPTGIEFDTGIVVAATTTVSGATGVSTGLVVALFYK